MSVGRSSLHVAVGRPGIAAASHMDYCQRLSAYLGLSLETVISLTRRDAPQRSTAKRPPAK